MPKTYTKPVCRGSYALGTACGACERCEDERRSVVYPAADASMTDLSAALAATPMPSSPLAELRELRWNSTEGPWTFDANCAGHILAGGSPIVTVRSHADAELIVGVVAYLDTLLAGNAENSSRRVVLEIAAERRRQVEAEGWSAQNDDRHSSSQLAQAAAWYALPGDLRQWLAGNDISFWQLDDEWWKPTTPRRDLVKAAALIVAEIERLDRASDAGKEGGR